MGDGGPASGCPDWPFCLAIIRGCNGGKSRASQPRCWEGHRNHHLMRHVFSIGELLSCPRRRNWMVWRKFLFLLDLVNCTNRPASLSGCQSDLIDARFGTNARIFASRGDGVAFYTNVKIPTAGTSTPWKRVSAFVGFKMVPDLDAPIPPSSPARIPGKADIQTLPLLLLTPAAPQDSAGHHLLLPSLD